MAEPELIITDDESLNEQSLQEGNTDPELNLQSEPDQGSELDEESEFELEPEFELEAEDESEELEFSLEEDTPLPLPPKTEIESQQLVTDFDEQTLENLLTEPEENTAARSETPSGETEFDVTSDADKVIPLDSEPEIIETAHATPQDPHEAEVYLTEEDNLTIEQASNTELASTSELLSTATQVSTLEKPPISELQANNPLHSGYSDDILSFPEGGAKPSEESEPSGVRSPPTTEVTTDVHDTQEKIDFSDTIEILHKPGTLHTQQAQQIELSILERVDDLIQVLQNKSKASGNPEQLPHKQFATGLHYIKHEKNHYLGAKWLRKAAIQGHAKAQMYLGMLFVQGKGVPRSFFHAYAWFSLAVCQDISEARDARKKLERHLTAKEINASLKYAADLLDRIHL